MKIVEIIPQLSSGGAERFVVDLCNQLSLAHDVTLILYYDLSQYGFYLHELSSRVSLISLDKEKGFSLSLYGLLAEEVKKIDPDVIHLHTRAINYAFPLIWKGGHARIFMTVHSAASNEAGGFLGRMLRQFCFKTGAIIPVTISSESLNSFRDVYGMEAPMIFNGRNVDMDLEVSEDVMNECRSYKVTSETKLLVNLARFTKVKRQDMLARVVARLVDNGYDIAMLFIGSHQDLNVLNDVASSGCSNIHILGEKANPLEYLKSADAFCLCSSYEGMPISLIEAMGVGVIPVCTPVGGIVDVINEYNGFLSEDNSEDSYYQVLKAFLDTDEETLMQMRENLKVSYKPYSMKECAARYESLFMNAINQ